MMTAKEIRDSYKKFFESKGHAIVPSAPMVIKDDPTLMFTNAGMNQWKDIILGTRDPEPRRRADTQKCLRVSGKHNDLEEVGHDTYHHTMFEMLGNWSFGDYFKEGAIDMAWEYLVDVLKLNPEDLYVTVFEGDPKEGLERDDEAAGYWLKHVSADHIINGNKHDNFWEMGDTGPCGPCSEIHVDSRTPEQKAASGKTGRELVNQDDPQVIEIWNLVFMQYNRKADGSLEKLAMNVIDTGMGFERLVRMMQGKHSNYDTDVFQPIIRTEEQITGLTYRREDEESTNGRKNENSTNERENENNSSLRPFVEPSSARQEEINVAMRVCADHLRAVAFSIADGQLPSNAKAGYVIRRILRRAVRYAYTFLGQKEAFLYKLLPTLVEEMGDAFPELKAQQQLIAKVMKEEEDSFLRTLEKGIQLLDKAMEQLRQEGKTELDGVQAFRLFDTYGFPLDLTEHICRENGFTVDEKQFAEEMQKQKDRARNAAAVENSDWVTLGGDSVTTEQQFVGYDYRQLAGDGGRCRIVLGIAVHCDIGGNGHRQLAIHGRIAVERLYDALQLAGAYLLLQSVIAQAVDLRLVIGLIFHGQRDLYILEELHHGVLERAKVYIRVAWFYRQVIVGHRVFHGNRIVGIKEMVVARQLIEKHDVAACLHGDVDTVLFAPSAGEGT